MITETVILAAPRAELGKNASRRLRAAGRIPAAVYGGGLDPIPVSVVAREMALILRSESGKNSIFTLEIEGHDSSPVMIKNMDVDPVHYAVLHTDLVRINMAEMTRVAIPIEFVGEPEGVKTGGGMFEVHLHVLEVECLPRDIPEKISFDVSGLQIGDQLIASQIPVDADSVTILHPDHLVAVVNGPTGGGAAEEPDEDAPAES